MFKCMCTNTWIATPVRLVPGLVPGKLSYCALQHSAGPGRQHPMKAWPPWNAEFMSYRYSQSWGSKYPNMMVSGPKHHCRYGISDLIIPLCLRNLGIYGGFWKGSPCGGAAIDGFPSGLHRPIVEQQHQSFGLFCGEATV